MKIVFRPLLLVVGLFGLWACPKEGERSPGPSEKAPVKAAPIASSDPECFGAWNPSGAAVTITAGERSFSRTGSKLVETSSDPEAKAVIGVLANTKEDTPENLANIDKALAFFKEQAVDVIVIDGDLGETQAQIEHVLEPIAGAGLLTLVTIGNREAKSDFNNALAAVAEKHPTVINMSQVRLALLDDVAFVSIPGYHDKAYIHAQNGCHYLATDLDASKAIVKEAGDKTVVLLSHGPPKQEGTEALDRTLEQANVGDPNLSAFIRDTGIKLGIFANIQEAGGRATDLSGSHLLGPDKPVSELFLNPGAIDAVSWKMNDQTRSVGMAAVMTVQGKEASFRSFRVPGSEAAPAE